MKSKFIFSELKSSDVPIAIQKVPIPPATQYPRHEHDFIEIVYIIKGSGMHLFEDEAYPIRQGDVYVIEPGQQHAYLVDDKEEMIVYNCMFLPSIISRDFNALMEVESFIEFFYLRPFIRASYHFIPQFNLEGSQSAKIKMLLDALHDEFNAKKTGHELILRIKFIELLLELSRSYTIEKQTLQKVKLEDADQVVQTLQRYIENNFTSPATIEQLCDLVGFSASHLSHIFKQKTGHSILQHYHYVRVEQACDLLIKTSNPISNIALDIGYNDISFFNKVFKRKMGCAPLEYRNRNI